MEQEYWDEGAWEIVTHLGAIRTSINVHGARQAPEKWSGADLYDAWVFPLAAQRAGFRRVQRRRPNVFEQLRALGHRPESGVSDLFGFGERDDDEEFDGAADLERYLTR